MTRTSSDVVDGGELVPLDRSLIDCSSMEPTEPLKLFARRRLVLIASNVDSSSFNCFRFTDGGNCGDDDVDDDDDVDEDADDSEDEEVDCVNFRLHLDCPVSRNPLANGLLSIFNFVMRSFCNADKKKTINGLFMRGKNIDRCTKKNLNLRNKKRTGHGLR